MVPDGAHRTRRPRRNPIVSGLSDDLGGITVGTASACQTPDIKYARVAGRYKLSGGQHLQADGACGNLACLMEARSTARLVRPDPGRGVRAPKFRLGSVVA